MIPVIYQTKKRNYVQPYQLELERESRRKSESEVNNNINKESTTKHLEVRVVTVNYNCECGKCSGIKEREIGRLFVLPRKVYS